MASNHGYLTQAGICSPALPSQGSIMSMETRTLTTPITEVQQQHVTIRAFTDQPVSDELVQALLNAGRRSPTSSNFQTYSI